MAADHSTSHIIQSLVANALIAVCKGVAAVLTGSGAMLAETLHSAADCGNQLLLLMGVKRAQKAPDAAHPLGYGRALYFWSFMVALLLFSGGGVFSIYEGIHKIMAPEPVEKVLIGLAVLGVSIVIEGAATISNIREINKRRGDKPFMRYVRETKDSDLIVVFGENGAATLGLLFASAALGIAHVTGDPRWDGVGSLVIGLVLVGVAVFLAVEVKSLLVGESADPEIEKATREVISAHGKLHEVLNIITVQQGPGEVLVALKVRLAPGLSCEEVCGAINDFEVALKAKRPEVRWLFVEPDVLK
ncbi:MAG: cation diffusion facilitator family transporter [Polyangiaceae bacterium]|nr:cation diffusion facilitator family transporter [Polyangiaceae bacterium]NUQ72753.1 cation diffusion facilitator family transporter [Polyangiaceae bacterium]